MMKILPLGMLWVEFKKSKGKEKNHFKPSNEQFAYNGKRESRVSVRLLDRDTRSRKIFWALRTFTIQRTSTKQSWIKYFSKDVNKSSSMWRYVGNGMRK